VERRLRPLPSPRLPALALVAALAGCQPTLEERLDECAKEWEEWEDECPEEVDRGAFTSMDSCLLSCESVFEGCEVDAYYFACTPPPCRE
jgi:hypothetical protein